MPVCVPSERTYSPASNARLGNSLQSSRMFIKRKRSGTNTNHALIVPGRFEKKLHDVHFGNPSFQRVNTGVQSAAEGTRAFRLVRPSALRPNEKQCSRMLKGQDHAISEVCRRANFMSLRTEA